MTRRGWFVNMLSVVGHNGKEPLRLVLYYYHHYYLYLGVSWEQVNDVCVKNNISSVWSNVILIIVVKSYIMLSDI